MNCDECQEQVFELIEREALDPEGVRDLLERCPECRASFEEIKAALASVSALPVEEPPAEIDAAIVRAARERSAQVVPLRPRRFQPPQWAVAAAALLAVGVGVWSIPRSENEVTEDALTAEPESPADLEAAGRADEYAEIAGTPSEIVVPSEVERVERDARVAAARSTAATSPVSSAPSAPPERAKRKAMRDAAAPKQRKASAPAAPEARQAIATGASADMAALEEDSEPSVGKAEKKAMSAECERRISRLDRLIREHELGAAALLSAEDALALGRCYQEAGDTNEAREWFETAASDPKTKRRALRALKELPAE